MPNYCNYEMKIKGSKKAIKRVLECLKANYNYSENKKPEHKHFFRVFEAFEGDLLKVNEKEYIIHIFGYCAWSVYSCMCEGEHTYFNDYKKSFGKNFMGTSLKKQSRNCEIEVFSEEPGCEFSEHYYFKNGECLIDECEQIQSGGYDNEGKPTTDIDWDTYEGETIIFNENRKGIEEEYNWII